MPLMRILLLARALQLSALRMFALLCRTGRCVDPLVSTSSSARGRCLVFSWGVIGPTSTLFAGPLPFQAPCWAKGLGGCRSQGCHGYLQAWLASHTAPPKPRHLPQAHRLAMNLTVVYYPHMPFHDFPGLEIDSPNLKTFHQWLQLLLTSAVLVSFSRVFSMASN